MKTREMKISNVKTSYHRKGICGNGFHVATFDWTDDDGQKRHMMATLFDESGSCAVLDVDETAKGNIDFACGNSWRGDHFEGLLRAAIAKES